MDKHTPGPWIFEFGHVWNRDLQLVAVAQHGPNAAANARLIAAAPELLAAQTMGSLTNTPDFLDWIASRLVNVYGESPQVDFVLSLRDRAKAGRDAIAKAKGVAP